jgi:hypothetical protein
MKKTFVLAICSAVMGVLAFSLPATAKTAKECQKEWRESKASHPGVTEKAYVEKCRAESAKETKSKKAEEKTKEPKKETKKETKTEKEKTATETGKKTTKACQAEWRANKAANEKNHITEKAYVEKCRAGTAMTEPKSMPEPSSMKKETEAPKTTEKEKMSHMAPATGTPAGADQYTTESQAKLHCLRGDVVWANLDTKIYHFAGTSDYGHTKKGAYMCESAAMKEGMRAAKNEKHP